MLQSEQVEELITKVSVLDRTALIQQFAHYPSSFPVDFTPEYLDRAPLEKLKHIFVALCLQQQKVPGDILAA